MCVVYYTIYAVHLPANVSGALKPETMLKQNSNAPLCHESAMSKLYVPLAVLRNKFFSKSYRAVATTGLKRNATPLSQNRLSSLRH